MQTRIQNWVLCAAGSVLIALGGPGCDDSCAFAFRCPAADATGGGGSEGEGGSGGADPCPADPADGPVSPECGVWVSASWGDDTHQGTQADPVRTITKAIELAEKGTRRVYACGDSPFVEAVSLPAGVSLAGGFSCHRGTWTYVGEKRWTTLSPAAGAVPLTLLAGEAESLITDVRPQAADAKEPGASSIAVISLQGAKATIRRGEIVAGNGADGADGEPGDKKGEPAKMGISGKQGSDACTMDAGLGGPQAELECGAVVSIGGAGGAGGPSSANDGQKGLQPPEPNDLGFGAGGQAESSVQGTPCTPGIGGAQGYHGVDGFGGFGVGQISKEGYVGMRGMDGGNGTPGQGGGGGGGSIGGAVCGGPGAPKGGAGGGSGGTGGCGGKGGKGGQAGGASIGVIQLGTGLSLSHLVIRTGMGGMGGNGGVLQPGGQPGFPGLGGAALGAVNAGCAGGAGGYGGDGGNGGGGRGGHSVGIAFAIGVPPGNDGTVNFDTGQQGAGGKGGNPSLLETNGAMGIPSASLAIPL